MARPLRVALLAGEVSGDIIGARLMSAIRGRMFIDPNCTPNCFDGVEFSGIGGAYMKDNGLDSLFPMSELSVMGFSEVLPHLWNIKKRIKQTAQWLRETRPDVVVTIDSKGFNLRVLEAFKEIRDRRSQRVIHYVPPSVWAVRGKELPPVSLNGTFDHVLTILPFEIPFFTHPSLQFATTFVGHPAFEPWFDVQTKFETCTHLPRNFWHTSPPMDIIQQGKFPKPDEVMKALNQNRTRLPTLPTIQSMFHKPSFTNKSVTDPVIAFLPGSRRQEVSKAVPQMKQVLDNLLGQGTRVKTVIIPVVDGVRDIVEHQFIGKSSKVEIVTSTPASMLQIFNSTHAAVATSGTVVTELAVSGVPTVVQYDTSFLTHMIVKRIAKVDHASIPNIMAGEEVIPEYLFHNCKPNFIADSLKRSLNTPRVSTMHPILSTLVPWNEEGTKPYRPSDVAADAVLRETWKITK